MIKKIFLISILLCFGFSISKKLYAQTHLEKKDSIQSTIIDTSGHIITDVDSLHSASNEQSLIEHAEHSVSDEHEENGHGGMEPLFFIIIKNKGSIPP